jgi:DNA repair exonuclease SbcCD ATPase subunit
MSKIASLKKVKPGTQTQEAVSCNLSGPAPGRELQVLSEKIVHQSAKLKEAENRLGQMEEKERLIGEKEQEIDRRLLDLADLKREQENEFKRRLSGLEEKRREEEEDYARRLAEAESLRARYEEEYQERLLNFENEMKERSDEIKKYLEFEFRDKEEDLVKREGQVQVRESVVAEKEKFWGSMYDAVVKLTRVVSACK